MRVKREKRYSKTDTLRHGGLSLRFRFQQPHRVQQRVSAIPPKSCLLELRLARCQRHLRGRLLCQPRQRARRVFAGREERCLLRLWSSDTFFVAARAPTSAASAVLSRQVVEQLDLYTCAR